MREGNWLKLTKNVVPQKGSVVAEVCGKTYSKILQRDGLKKAIDIKKNNPAK